MHGALILMGRFFRCMPSFLTELVVMNYKVLDGCMRTLVVVSSGDPAQALP